MSAQPEGVDEVKQAGIIIAIVFVASGIGISSMLWITN